MGVSPGMTADGRMNRLHYCIKFSGGGLRSMVCGRNKKSAAIGDALDISSRLD